MVSPPQSFEGRDSFVAYRDPVKEKNCKTAFKKNHTKITIDFPSALIDKYGPPNIQISWNHYKPNVSCDKITRGYKDVLGNPIPSTYIFPQKKRKFRRRSSRKKRKEKLLQEKAQKKVTIPTVQPTQVSLVEENILPASQPMFQDMEIARRGKGGGKNKEGAILCNNQIEEWETQKQSIDLPPDKPQSSINQMELVEVTPIVQPTQVSLEEERILPASRPVSQDMECTRSVLGEVLNKEKANPCNIQKEEEIVKEKNIEVPPDKPQSTTNPMDVVEKTQTVHNNQVDILEEEKTPPAPWPMSKDIKSTKRTTEEDNVALFIAFRAGLQSRDLAYRKEMDELFLGSFGDEYAAAIALSPLPIPPWEREGGRKGTK